MSDLQIRPARDDELDDVAALIVDAWAEYAANMSPDAWSSYANDIANVHGRRNDAELLVAERDGRLVGAVTMFLGWRGVQEGSCGVKLLSVLPDQRGAGVGRALVEAVIERARQAGRQRVVMTTTQEMGAVRDLTDSMGFQRDPSLDHQPAPGVRAEGYALQL